MVTARGALLAVVVFALVVSALPWHCHGRHTTAGAAAGAAVPAVVAHKAHVCDEESVPPATAEPARSPLARQAVIGTAGIVDEHAVAQGVAGAGPDAARGDPPSEYVLCVLRT